MCKARIAGLFLDQRPPSLVRSGSPGRVAALKSLPKGDVVSEASSIQRPAPDDRPARRDRARRGCRPLARGRSLPLLSRVLAASLIMNLVALSSENPRPRHEAALVLLAWGPPDPQPPEARTHCVPRQTRFLVVPPVPSHCLGGAIGRSARPLRSPSHVIWTAAFSHRPSLFRLPPGNSGRAGRGPSAAARGPGRAPGGGS